MGGAEAGEEEDQKVGCQPVVAEGMAEAAQASEVAHRGAVAGHLGEEGVGEAVGVAEGVLVVGGLVGEAGRLLSHVYWTVGRYNLQP